MTKAEALKTWKELPENQPILPHFTPLDPKARGSRYGACGIRIDGNPKFVRAVMSRLKDLIDGENHVTRLGLTERVILTKPDSWGNFEYFRRQGASKQVAAELTAQIQHEAREQIATWYNEGWQWWVVCCEMNGLHESLSGIDSEEYARDEVRGEIASEMAHALEKAGYFIAGRPESDLKPYNHLCSHLRWKLAHKGTEGVNAFNWKG